MPSVLQPLQAWAERRLPALTRYRRLEPMPIELHRRRIYIVPTRFGLGFSILLLVMLVGALNYANNAALLLTCLLGAASSTSMLSGFRNLDGLALRQIRAGYAIAGQPIEVMLAVETVRARQAIRLDMDDESTAFAVPANETAVVKLLLPTSVRGWQPLPRLRIWTTWPIGLFRAWSWLRPDQSVLVWPLPEAAGPPPRGPADDARHMRLYRGDELASLREYRPGDPQRHIAWKASAHHDNLLVKDFELPEHRPQWQLDWRQLRAMDNESRIARLARWVGEAQAQRRTYSLWLPGTEIAAGSGPLHYAHCMNALAQLP